MFVGLKMLKNFVAMPPTPIPPTGNATLARCSPL